MDNIHCLEKIDIAQKRKDIEDLCAQLFLYMLHLQRTGKEPLSLNRFVIVRALEEIFYPSLLCVSGYSIFIPIYDEGKADSDLVLHPHHWLAFKDNNKYIIDVLPCDGDFGVSVPQLVVQNKRYKRFIPAGSMYPIGWNKEDRDSFNEHVSLLVSVFEEFLR